MKNYVKAVKMHFDTSMKTNPVKGWYLSMLETICTKSLWKLIGSWSTFERGDFLHFNFPFPPATTSRLVVEKLRNPAIDLVKWLWVSLYSHRMSSWNSPFALGNQLWPNCRCRYITLFSNTKKYVLPKLIKSSNCHLCDLWIWCSLGGKFNKNFVLILIAFLSNTCKLLFGGWGCPLKDSPSTARFGTFTSVKHRGRAHPAQICMWDQV